MDKKVSLNVQMDGKTYIQYENNRDRLNRERSARSALFIKKNRYPILLAAGLLGFALMCAWIIDILTPHNYVKTEYFNFYGVPIMSFMPSICLIVIALGILVHGIAIIRR